MYKHRIVGHDVVNPQSLLANPLNYRIHSLFQQNTLHTILEEVGYVQSVIVNTTTQHIVDGHLRVHLALSHQESVPVTYVELTEDEEKRILATFDPISQLAQIDQQKFAELINDVKEFDASISSIIHDDVPLERVRAQDDYDTLNEKTKSYMLVIELSSYDEYTELRNEMIERGLNVKGNNPHK